MPGRILNRHHAMHWSWLPCTALSICLVGFIGLLPLFQAAHLAFADHDHQYCPEHGRIEDVPRSRLPDSIPPSGVVTDRHIWSTGIGALAQKHAVCAVSNLDVSRYPVRLTPPPSASGLTVTHTSIVVTSAGVVSSAFERLLTAPKTSPPIATA